MSDRGDRRLHAVQAELLAEANVSIVQNEALIQDRRQQICEAALELFLEKGFASTTIRDICARSGVNPASIYDYIANKNDILRRLLNQLWFREDVATLPELLADDDLTLEAAIAEFLATTWTHKRKGAILAYRSIPHLEPADRRALHKRERAMMLDLAEQLNRRMGLPRDDHRMEVVANLMGFLGVFGPLRDWLHDDQPDAAVLDAVAFAAVAMIRAAAEAPPVP